MPNTAISLTLRASERLRGWLIVSHLLPLLFLIIHRPEPFSLLFAVPAFWLWRRSVRLAGLSGAPDDIAAVHFKDEQWGVTLVSGQKRVVDLHYATGFYRYWQFLLFKDDVGKMHRTLIVSDSTDSDSFRRLTVLLRLRKKNAGFRF